MRNRQRPDTMRRTRALAIRFAMAAALAATSLVAVGPIAAQELAGSTAVVTGSDDGANLRDEPTTAARVLATLADGTAVTLRTDEAESVVDDEGILWWPVAVDGDEGWIAGDYLAETEAEAGAVVESESASASAEGDEGEQGDDEESAPGEPLGLVTPDFAAGQDVAVQTDDGGGLAMRTGPAQDEDEIAGLGEGDVVEVVDGPFWDANDEGWYLIDDGDIEAYVYGAFLVAESADTADEADASDDTAEARDEASDEGDDGDASAGEALGFVTPDLAAGQYVAVETDDGGGLAMRTGPAQGAEEIAGLGEGDVVRVVDGPFWDANDEGWYLISDGDIEAYVYGAFVTPTDAPDDGDEPAAVVEDAAEPAEEAAEPEAEAEREAAAFARGDFVATAAGSGGANLRRSASASSRRVGALNEATPVEITRGPVYDDEGEDWYRVEVGDGEGYVLGDLLGAADPPAAEPAPQSGPTGAFIYPVAGYTFTQAFGCTGFSFEPFDPNIGCNFHNGIDLAAPAYTPIMAADGGVVTFAGWCDCGLGFYVEIDHGNGLSTQYGHMAEQPYVGVGQSVNQGDVVGPIGSTGLSTGPHLHFVVEVNGVATDPLAYL